MAGMAGMITRDSFGMSRATPRPNLQGEADCARTQQIHCLQPLEHNPCGEGTHVTAVFLGVFL